MELAEAVSLDGPVPADAGRAGWDEEFRAFYAGQFPDVAGYCQALTRDADLADEIAQEALTRVYARWPLLREPRAYAFRIAHNLTRSHWAARQRELSTWSQLPVDPPPAADPAVWDAVNRLPERYRDVVLLHYVADLPVHEVARALRRPAGTVKRRLHEARALLAVTLGDDRDR